MSKVKKLAEKFGRFDISVDVTVTTKPETPFGAKATVTILNENNSVLIRVVGENFGSADLHTAQKAAVDQAIDRILGNKETTKLGQTFKSFDISSSAMSTGNKNFPVGVKSVVTAYDDNGKVVRKAHGVSMGTDGSVVEKEALKEAINRVLGV